MVIMAEAYPIELRDRVVHAYEAGIGSYTAVAELFGVGEATVKRWVRRFRERGDVKPDGKSGGARSTICLEELKAIVKELGDANAGEITAAYNRGRRRKDQRHVSSIKRALYRAGFVVKKSAFGHWSNSGPT
ncbi:MAG: helix-turn-helix domain-containing protein [Pseudomonadota bacterium]